MPKIVTSFNYTVPFMYMNNGVIYVHAYNFRSFLFNNSIAFFKRHGSHLSKRENWQTWLCVQSCSRILRKYPEDLSRLPTQTRYQTVPSQSSEHCANIALFQGWFHFNAPIILYVTYCNHFLKRY